MGNVVKFCSGCKEDFIEKFSFCPNCSAVLIPQNLVSNDSLNNSFNVTFVEGKINTSRKGYLLGATFFVMSGAIFGLVSSIYNADVYVKGLDDSLVYLASISEENPNQLDNLELPEDRKKGDGSGGGGGGRKDKTEVSKGELPPQFKENPLLTPSKEDISVSNPTLKVIRATKGPQDIIPDKISKTNGLPQSSFEVASDGYSDFNSGMGRNGERGIGSDGRDGVGRNGEGGIGTNKGDKYGDLVGSSENAETDDKRKKEIEDPPQIAKGETVALKITDKPRAIYTNDARKNQIAGTVTLRVTFMANGSIGNVAVISSLPDGLTEQAIAAAKNIKFEPAKRNGVAQTVSKQVQYTFTLY